jgi:ribosomal protein L14
MKNVVRALFAVAVLSFVAGISQAEPRQVMRGTQVHLKLLTDVSSGSSRNGDSFIAVTTEPVMVGNEMMLPAGTKIRGIVNSISRARHFALIRGEAYMNLSFRSIEIDSRLIPVQMSILDLTKPSEEGEGRRRKDVDVTEGQMLQEKHDIKGDIIAGTIGTGGSTLIGKLAAHAAAGFGIGLAGSAIYVAQRKGREVTLPADTGMLVRMDSTFTVPGGAIATGATSGGQ